MNIRSLPFHRNSGSTLLTAIVVTACIGIAIGSYLHLVQSQNRLVMNSMTWNEALPMAEAGVEEAMTHLSRNTATNLSADGWTVSSNSCSLERSLGTNFYQVTATHFTNGAFGSTNNYRIRSTGYVQKPGTSSYVARTVVVNASAKFLFLGMVAKNSIRLGGNFYADSYDSDDPSFSTGGQYDPAKKDDDAFIGTNSQTNNSRVQGGVKVLGSMASGPGGAIDIGGASSVGDASWSSSGFQTGAYRDDLNVAIPNISVPFSYGSPVSSGSIAGTNYAAILDGGNFTVSSLNGKVYVSSASSLYVSTSMDLESVVILPGASLTLYVGAASVTMNGNSIFNLGGDTESFQYIGLDSNTQLRINGDASITGTIYAPAADVVLLGNAVLFGALACNTITAGGTFDFHYDESLGKTGVPNGFHVTSWTEETVDYTASGLVTKKNGQIIKIGLGVSIF